MFDAMQCVVTPEWTAIAGGILNAVDVRVPFYRKVYPLRPIVSLQNVQTDSGHELRQQELALLTRLLCKNKFQHRKTTVFQQLERIARLLRLVNVTKLLRHWQDRMAVACKPLQTPHERPVPTAQDTLIVLRRLMGVCNVALEVAQAIIHAGAALLGDIAKSMFLPFSLAAVGIIARIRALNARMLLDMVQAYNAVVELVPLLPGFHECQGQMRMLPNAVSCRWRKSLPCLDAVSAPITDGKNILDPSQMLRIVPKQTLRSSREDKSLSVIEDRGVVISREDIQRELVASAEAIDTHTGAGGYNAATDEAPAYERTLPAVPVGVKFSRPTKARHLSGGQMSGASMDTQLQRHGATHSKIVIPKALTALPPLSPRSTAYIDVSSLVTEKAKRSDDMARPAAFQSHELSWERWLVQSSSQGSSHAKHTEAKKQSGKKRRR